MWEKQLYLSKINAVLDLKWQPRHQRAVNRPQNALSFRVAGDCDFIHGNTTFHTATNDILFMPRQYDYWQDAHTEEHLICVHFDLAGDIPPSPLLHHPRRPHFFGEYFARLLQLWTEKPIGYEYAAVAIVNRILEAIVTEQQSKQPTDEALTQIVTYLNQNFASPELSVHGLAQMAGISETLLRDLFHKRFGCAPHRYIAELRARYAESLLVGGYYTVEETAAFCGFSSAKNFATFLKKETGHTPRELK